MATLSLLHGCRAFIHGKLRAMGTVFVRRSYARERIRVEKVYRVLRICSGIVISAGCSLSQTAYGVDYTIHVKTTSPALASELLAQATTGYFIGTGTKSTTFANTWNVTITGKKPAAPPSGTVSAQDLLNALISVSSSTYPYGWGNGMLYERADNINSLYGMQGYDFAHGTVGGRNVQGGYTVPQILGSTIPVAGFETRYVSTGTVAFECLGIYNAAVSTITIKGLNDPPIIPGF